MAECVTDRSAGVMLEGARSRRWSAGVLGATHARFPEACLEHCLGGDPMRAPTHGCAMLRYLVTKEEPQGGAGDLPVSFEAPAVCDKGYAVSLFEGDGVDSPDVLTLRPLAVLPEMDEAFAPAIEMIRTLAVDFWRGNRENNDLAEEVLRGYEQINLIFDISAQIARLADADQVRQTLLLKLRHMFDADAVFLVFADRNTGIQVDRDGGVVRGWVVAGSKPAVGVEHATKVGGRDAPGISRVDLPPEFDQAHEQLTTSRRVFVSASDSVAQSIGRGTAMWGALTESETGFAIVGIIRRQVYFTSGDMLLLDSTLTFGGHILRNLQLVEQLKRTSFEVVRTLVNAVDQKDKYTSGHSERVGFLARATGQDMGLSGEQVQELEWAALLHDVGKIGIPEHVLNKPGRLTEEEYAVIKGHPSRGHDILKPVGSLEPVVKGVLYHHENPDGTGYPRGLKGEEIPLLARIIHVVDVFDALTSTRSYRQAFEAAKALAILKQDAGTKLDIEIVECFLAAWARLPVTHPEEYERWFSSGKEGSA